MRVVRTLLGATLVCDHHRLLAVGLRGVLSQLWRSWHMRQATVCSVIVDRLENVLEVPHGPLLHLACVELVFVRLRSVFIVLLFLATSRLTPVSCVKFLLSALADTQTASLFGLKRCSADSGCVSVSVGEVSEHFHGWPWR